ncbi:protein DpdF [Acidisphaera rubrifaciens]|uniref:Helicase n=1 Tax=Acidisphaera rubrifaciens HS-AP3 TaxID=1231350 RepID=A0A0D6P3D3_9PROT|nr:protein DpdF [Acidisphaera rubrifaciens]GAN75851.1 helicase [Acidisphaera rubrifaciens HS-AP3]
MTRLAEGAGFTALGEALCGRRDADSFSLEEIAAERLRLAIGDPSASPLDLALLVRHALLAEGARQGGGEAVWLPRPKKRACSDEVLALAGLEPIGADRVRARPWRPGWLADSDPDPDRLAAASIPRRFEAAGPPPDPFISQLGYATYRSVGQRAAVRSALLTPEGRTLAIDLPTGEGKSAIFHAIDAVGFASAPIPANEGVTLVVVPTVALAYDHENNVRAERTDPLAYVGDNAERRAAIIERLSTQQTGLVFCAPEAACGSLRGTLISLAEAGRLKALVLDEAHLVDAWGTGFRPEFQSLAGLRAELLAACPAGARIRTLLLSATLTPETLDTLEVLFARPERLELLSAAQVRPEPAYVVAPQTDATSRNLRVEEAILRLPRPMILYVTKVADAVAWAHRFAALGLSRFAAFHGDTPDNERAATLKRWSKGELDLVVATSAFGLGIDYPQVRAVVHGCVPETFDRFYQEVGRGGRDGRTSLSLLLPSHSDVKLARGLNRERVITVRRGLERWRSMFEHPQTRHLGDKRFKLRLDVAPGPGIDDIDLVGERSLQWNARVLTLMARCGLLRMVGGVRGESSEDGVFETVEILDDQHLLEEIWDRKVEPVRGQIARARSRNLALMVRHLRGGECPASLIEELYGASRILKGCSNCQICRADPARAQMDALPLEPAAVWPAPALSSTLSGLLSDGEFVVTFDATATGAYASRRMAAALSGLTQGGMRVFRLVGDTPPVFERGLADLATRPVFLSRSATSATSRLPPGPEVVIVGETPWRLSPPGRDPRILILPSGAADPDRPGEGLLDRYNRVSMTLDTLLERLST